jgi:hypothetical protein
MDHPRSADQIYDDYQNRFRGLLRALTEEEEDLYQQCDPERENLCLYGESDGSWAVDLPAEEVPAELPEPCLGINFARNGMQRRDWLALVAVHSDAWLLSVAFYYGARLDAAGRAKLFKTINQGPTLFEIVMGQASRLGGAGAVGQPRNRKEADQPTGVAKAADVPMSTGRLATMGDIHQLKGRQAELFWPDDNKWYLIQVQSVNPKLRTAKVQYTSGEVEEDLDLDQIIRDGHMSILT